MIRSIWVWSNGVVSTLVIGSMAIAAGWLGIRNGNVHGWFARVWSRWLLFVNGTPVEVEGLEHIAADRPQIIVSNHESWFDVFAIAAYLPKRTRFIAKKELGTIPIFGRAWKSAGHISIDRRNTAAAIVALEQAAILMRQDNSAVVIFPEGTRGPGNGLLPFKKGAFMLAVVSGVEIVPTAVLGSRAIMPRDSWRVRGGRITLRFAPPVATTAYTEANRDELIARVRGDIEQLLAPALPRGSQEEQPGSR